MFNLVGAIDSDLEIVSQDFSCNGSSITFECTVNGNKMDMTVWKDTAFSGCEINLLHNRFEESTGSETRCNNGNITLTGRSISVENNSYYISQLEVIVKPADVNDEMIMKNIECIHDDGTDTTLIGSMNINVSVICSNITLTLKGNAQLIIIAGSLHAVPLIIMVIV